MIRRAGALGSILAGFAAWTLTEYVGHRWIMHGSLPPRFVAAEHAAHHRQPDNMDLGTSLVYNAVGGAVAIGGAAVLSAATGRDLRPAAGGFTAGAFAYSRAHWNVHRDIAATGDRTLTPHGRHHFQSVHHNYGFTTTLWDRVFGTYQGRP